LDFLIFSGYSNDIFDREMFSVNTYWHSRTSMQGDFDCEIRPGPSSRLLGDHSIV
jgi:hypothetical protein